MSTSEDYTFSKRNYAWGAWLAQLGEPHVGFRVLWKKKRNSPLIG